VIIIITAIESPWRKVGLQESRLRECLLRENALYEVGKAISVFNPLKPKLM
jgi:hypothetical protein